MVGGSGPHHPPVEVVMADSVDPRAESFARRKADAALIRRQVATMRRDVRRAKADMARRKREARKAE